ncbi:MAG: hypothetical protein J0L67_12825 [Cytophagales bacterium]|nr:hypothetical protein [Cytophagales bacterium]
MVDFHEYFLVKIRFDKVTVENLKTGETKGSDATLKFSNDRLLIVSPTEPAETIKRFVDQLSVKNLFQFKRTIIINARHPNILKFEETEKMMLRDVGAQAGSNIYLSFDEEVNAKEINLSSLSLRFEL